MYLEDWNILYLAIIWNGKLGEMDERVAIFAQMEEDVDLAILINKFSVSPEKFDQFLKGWANEAEKFMEPPGFISTQLHRDIGWKRYLR